MHQSWPQTCMYACMYTRMYVTLPIPVLRTLVAGEQQQVLRARRPFKAEDFRAASWLSVLMCALVREPASRDVRGEATWPRFAS